MAAMAAMVTVGAAAGRVAEVGMEYDVGSWSSLKGKTLVLQILHWKLLSRSFLTFHGVETRSNLYLVPNSDHTAI
jgi:hypothetical protein